MHRNRSLTLVLALAAGLLGGFLSPYITLPSVHAQRQPSNALEIRSQRFIVVDAEGHVIGTFAGSIMQEPSGRTRSKIELVDPTGRELWSAGGSGFKQISENSK